jgi:hypothetical protein
MSTTVLRSPWIADFSVCSAVTRTICAGRRIVDGDVSNAAHSSQNFAPGLLAAPHCGHLATKAVAHSLQNFAHSRLVAPHFETPNIWHAGHLVCQLIEEGFGVDEVGGIEALAKPIVDVGEHRARFVAPSLFRQQPCETGCRTQFE